MIDNRPPVYVRHEPTKTAALAIVGFLAGAAVLMLLLADSAFSNWRDATFLGLHDSWLSLYLAWAFACSVVVTAGAAWFMFRKAHDGRS